MSKHPRHQTVINRNADENIGEDHWLKQFEKNLQKAAVQPRQIEDTIYNQINSIMNGKSKYPSVEAAVDDMMQRSGLIDYLHKVKVSDKNIKHKKVATTDINNVIEKDVDMEKMVPIVIKKCPSIKNTIENYIRDSRGNLSVPAIISKIHGIHNNDVSSAQDWEDDNLIRYVSKLNLEAKKNNPASFETHTNLGGNDAQTSDSEIDPSNMDAFHSLTPVKF